MKVERQLSDVRFVECLLTDDSTSFPESEDFGDISALVGRNTCPLYIEVELIAFDNATLTNVWTVGKNDSGRYRENVLNADANIVLTARTVDFDAEDIDLTANSVEITDHGFENAQGPVHISSDDTLPNYIEENTNYWIIVVDSDNIKFATSYANALAGTAINLADIGEGEELEPGEGVGTHTLNIPDKIFRQRLDHSAVTSAYSFMSTAHTAGKYVQFRVIPVYKVWMDG